MKARSQGHRAKSAANFGAPSKLLSAAANGIAGFIARHGASPDAVLWSAGLDETVGEDGRQILDLSAYCAMLEAAARQTGNDNFGLHYGRDFVPERLGLIGRIVIASPTVADALGNLSRYFPFHQQNTFTAFRSIGDLWHLEYRILDGHILERRHDAELTLGMYFNILRHLLGPTWWPEEVHFEHARPAEWQAHANQFGAPVYFGMGSNAIVFREREIWRPAPGWKAGQLEELREALVNLTGGTGQLDLVAKVSGEIRSCLAAGSADITSIAEKLGMARWTLQRRLAESGHVFSDMVDETRRRLALLYLRQTHLSLSDIATLLGYSELSAFSRACIRWFDAAPSDLRLGLGLMLPEVHRPN